MRSTCRGGLLTISCSYAGAMAAFIFVTLSLGKCLVRCEVRDSNVPRIASGLLWLSELIEEHSRAAKSFGQRGIYVRVIFILENTNTFSSACALGDHRASRPPVLLRLAALTPSPIFDRVPHRLPPKLHPPMASSVSDIYHIPRILRHGHRRPLPVVLLLRSRDPRRTTQGTAVLRIAQGV